MYLHIYVYSDFITIVLFITCRTMHYPPESHNIMLLCRLLATIELSPSPQQANKTVSNVN